MSNIHPLFREALAPFAPPAMRPFAVSIRTGAKPEEINVMAASSGDAITKAVDIFFDADGVAPPDGLTISASPIPNLPRAV